MAITVAQLQTKISVDDAAANKSLDDVGDKVNKTGGFFSNLASTALGVFTGGALAGGFGFLAGQIGDAIATAGQYQQVQAQLAQGIKSTGDASGETVPALEDLADKYSKLTTFSAAAIEQSEAVTLTFTNIGQNVFPQATMAAEDLATRMGEDLPSATLQLDKALGNPIQGITALTRVGVVFTEQQKEQIKAMAASGNMAGAQAIILKELQKEFGGSAEAAGKTLPGALAIMGNELEDTKEKIGAGLIPVLSELLTAVMPVVTWVGGNLPTALGALDGAITGAVNIGQGLIKFFGDAGPLATSVKVALAILGGAMLGLAATAIPAAVTAVVASVTAFGAQTIAAGAAAAATIAATWPFLAIGAAIAGLVIGLKVLIDHWGPVSQAFNNSGFGQAVLGVLGHIRDAIGGLLGDLGRLKDTIGNVLGGAGNVLSHIPGFATGGTLPEGWALVGEQGPELIRAPGAQVYPMPSGIPSGGGGGGAGAGGGASSAGGGSTTIILQVDGRQLAQAVVRHVPGVIRQATGVRAF